MKVGIITCMNCMTCMFAVALTLEGPIRRQTSQSEKTFHIGGNVTLLCPLVTDDTLEWIYWQKNNRTIYSRNVNSQTTTTNYNKYEGMTYATQLTIKDLQKTDIGIYHCKVSTTANMEEGGHVMIYVTDQEGGIFTSPGFALTTSTTIPPKLAECNTIILAFSISTSILITIIIILITLFVLKSSKLCRRIYALVPTDYSHRETRNETTETREPQVPLVGRIIIDDLRRVPNGDGRLFMHRMTNVLHSFRQLHEGEDVLPRDGKYSFLKKYVWCIPEDVLNHVIYCLNELNHIPVGRERDVYEILLTMPENQQVDKSTFYSESNKDIFKEYDQDDQGNAIKYEEEARSTKLRLYMRMILGTKPETRDDARNKISMIILNASVSLNQQSASRLNWSTSKTPSKTQQGSSVSFWEKLPQRDTDLEREDDNLIAFWLSIVTKLQPDAQRKVMDQFFDYLENAPDHSEMPYDDGKKEKINNLIDSTDLEPQPSTSSRPPSTNLQLLSRKQALDEIAKSDEISASQLKDRIKKQEKEEKNRHEEKSKSYLVM